jgi:ABC-type transport system substrate-binding protein
MAEAFLYPTTPEAQATESSIVRYDFDPRKSARMIESLGFTKGGDNFYRDSGGQQLRIEIRATSGEANPKTMYGAGEYLQRVGVAIDPVVIPLQLVDDQRYRATFPGLIVNGGPADTGLEDFHSNQARVPETNFSGRNRSRYMNPELDVLIDRYLTTIPFAARMEPARQITRHVTENLPALPLFFDTWPSATASRLTNVGVSANGGYLTWNAYEWDVTPAASSGRGRG